MVQSCFSIQCAWIMLRIVLLTLFAGCHAKLGYQYEAPSGVQGYENYEEQLDVDLSAQLPENYQLQTDNQYQSYDKFHKHFYAFEAPYDNAEEKERVEHKLSAVAEKNLQVVFIKTPDNKALEGALHAYAKQSSQDKTAIYVLNKQSDPEQLAGTLSVLRSQHKSQPEVHFVKYRTEEEAKQAQQHIQAEYGGAEGAEETVAPVAPALPDYGSAAQEVPLAPLPQAPVAQPQNTYLPAVPQPNPVSYLPETPQYVAAAQVPLQQPQQTYLPPNPVNYLSESPNSLAGPPKTYLPALPQALPQTNHGGYLPESAQVPVEQPQQTYLPPNPLSYSPEFPNYVAVPQPPQKTYLPQPIRTPQLPQIQKGKIYVPPAIQPAKPLGYLPEVPRKPSYAQSYQGPLDLPPVPLAAQELDSSPYDLEGRNAVRSDRVDFRLNERNRHGSRLVFPSGSEASPRSYQAVPVPVPNTYLPPVKRKRRVRL